MTRGVLLGFLMVALGGGAQLAAQAAPSATDGWVAAPAAGATTAEGYAVIENPTMYEVFIVKVTADVAGAVDIVSGTDGATTVRELPVPAYGRAELKPGAIRFRLKDLKKPIAAGDSVELTLTTDGGATITVRAPVKAG